MSKEFEEWKKREGFSDIMEGYDSSFRSAFAAGRALGRREMKADAADIAFDLLVDGVTWGYDGNCGSPEIVRAAIEAIPEEVGEAE